MKDIRLNTVPILFVLLIVTNQILDESTIPFYNILPNDQGLFYHYFTRVLYVVIEYHSRLVFVLQDGLPSNNTFMSVVPGKHNQYLFVMR